MKIADESFERFLVLLRGNFFLLKFCLSSANTTPHGLLQIFGRNLISLSFPSKFQFLFSVISLSLIIVKDQVKNLGTYQFYVVEHIQFFFLFYCDKEFFSCHTVWVSLTGDHLIVQDLYVNQSSLWVL